MIDDTEEPEPPTTAVEPDTDAHDLEDDAAAPTPSPTKTRLKLVVLSSLIVIEAIVIIWAVHPGRRKKWEDAATREQRELAEQAAAHERMISGILERGDAFLEIDDISNALKCYKDAKTLAPDDPRIESIIANARAILRARRLAAQAALESEQRRAQDAALRKRVEDLVTLGDKDEQAGDLTNALARYKEALLIAPDDRTIKSLIANVQARIEEQKADAARADPEPEPEPAVADEKREEAARLLASGDSKYRKKRYTDALEDYTGALAADPENTVIRDRITTVRKAIALEIQRARPKNEWSMVIRVGSMTVQSLALDNGRSVDMLITARGGVIRIGKLDSLGKAQSLYFENRHPSVHGGGNFVLEGDKYHIQWTLLPDRISKYRIRVTKPKAAPAEETATP